MQAASMQPYVSATNNYYEDIRFRGPAKGRGVSRAVKGMASMQVQAAAAAAAAAVRVEQTVVFALVTFGRPDTGVSMLRKHISIADGTVSVVLHKEKGRQHVSLKRLLIIPVDGVRGLVAVGTALERCCSLGGWSLLSSAIHSYIDLTVVPNEHMESSAEYWLALRHILHPKQLLPGPVGECPDSGGEQDSTGTHLLACKGGGETGGGNWHSFIRHRLQRVLFEVAKSAFPLASALHDDFAGYLTYSPNHCPDVIVLDVGGPGQHVLFDVATARPMSDTHLGAAMTAPTPDATQWTEYCDGLTFNNGVMTTTISSFSVITIGVTDLTAPTISSVSVVKLRNRGNALRLSFKVDEECPVYYVVLVGGSATPTATQVVSGQAADGTTVQQVDPRVAPIVHQSGVLSYDSDDSSILQFTIKGLASETTYDIHVVGQDAQGNLGTTLMVQQDTADVTPPKISIFYDAGHKYYKRGSPIAQDFFTAFDAYDGDLTEKVSVVGTLSTQEDISSVKLRVSDSSGNTAVTYVTCNCATCYTGQQTVRAHKDPYTLAQLGNVSW
ncbi:hypothetical protein CYMTET_52691 [Cymbomonas tetramitiformis]|uniref:Uncharacterized protein n=1 Tax=Cymbomonas tetramitiformis TaxID=36881 RepID=A0AAE0ESH6_9CHLO|nr:hypothetical protein CYMTET_52691 [Cymbomonas tetramitiformis]